MAQRPSPVRGMRDVLPDAAERRQWLEATIHHEFARFGYRPIETPALEDLRFLESGQGGDNEKLIFKTLRRGLSLEQISDVASLADAGLRFDLTVPLARFYATNAPNLPSPFRAVQIGPVWRAERPQRGRYRQFTQCDIDILGEASLLAEIELLSAGSRALAAVGLEEFTIRLNHRRLLSSLLGACGFPDNAHGHALIVVDKLDKIDVKGVERELADAGHPHTAITQLSQVLARSESAGTPDQLAEVLPAGVDEESLEELRTIASAVALPEAAPKARLVMDLSLVRGMGYYTGPIFEVAAPGLGSSIAGGGRYDEMIGRIGGQPTPACGFSIGFERLAEVLAPASGQREHRVALLWRSDQDLARVAEHADRLRDRGDVVETVHVGGKGKGVYKRLAASGFDLVVQALDESEPRPLST
ncbi:histidine--tRNA ligase [Nocardiopsis metallicus]|uniref:Histidine--tRNA ligase n=1 Tax=Nocardiopsis metallicus TaxID=179819 RepID=A0A840W5H9_9ACTN|nr:histidine--tRNA ligase [Nocardiopsis metallicus]MBB5492220.1 histidyl-tRNA synthetase [Nocardiopsis metallicus]